MLACFPASFLIVPLIVQPYISMAIMKESLQWKMKGRQKPLVPYNNLFKSSTSFNQLPSSRKTSHLDEQRASKQREWTEKWNKIKLKSLTVFVSFTIRLALGKDLLRAVGYWKFTMFIHNIEKETTTCEQEHVYQTEINISREEMRSRRRKTKTFTWNRCRAIAQGFLIGFSAALHWSLCHREVILLISSSCGWVHREKPIFC